MLPSIFLCSAGTSAQNLAGVAAIAGITIDAATGKPLAGVILTAKRAGLPPLSINITSNAAGIYVLPGLAEGTYTICAQFPGGGYLDPCQWNLLPPAVKLAISQRLTGNEIKLVPGSVLQVNVNDPGQLLNKKNQAGLVGDLSVGVWGTRGLFHPARLTGTDSSGAHYQITIPRDTLVAVHVARQHLKLADAKGVDLPGNFLQQTFQHKTGDANPLSFTFSITGLKQ